jgi:clan AA aspartic protease (TIGR02281 family)
LKDYSQAISISSNYYYAYLARGRFYKEKIKDEKKAKEDLLMVLKLDTSVGSSGNRRGNALFYLNRSKEALEWQNKILEEYPNEYNYYDASCLYSLMKMPKETIDNLRLAFEDGFRNFIRISNDEDFNNVKNNPDFIALIKEWKTKYELTKSKNPIETKVDEVQKYQTATIPMKARGSGTYEVSCKVNDLKLNFIFDTGASDISISQTEALFMLKNDYLTEADIKGNEKYIDANGDISVGTKIMLKKVEIGGIVLKNVSASVVNNKNAPLLFGQSALSKYGKIIIDNKKNEITISIPETK